MDFVDEDMSDMIKKGFWVVLPLDQVAHLEDLHLSPLGVVPQRERRPRIIVDYTFNGINDDTDRQAPQEAMQFGRALDRVLLAVLRAPAEHGPVYLLKLDLSDGFYRIQVRPEDVAKLGVIYPTPVGAPKLVAFPLVLPMGWTESPPWFCSATETVVDLANAYSHSSWSPGPHHLEKLASTSPPPATDGREVLVLPAEIDEGGSDTAAAPGELPPRPNQVGGGRRPLHHVDVYVDDEIVAAQGPPSLLRRHRRQLLHLNDRVFRPNDAADSSLRQEPVSIKKLQKGDACFATYKTILGWNIDTLRKTIELPEHRRERLLEILADTKDRKRITKSTAHKLLGELRSMLLAVSGGSGLLSQLQHSLRSSPGSRVRLNQSARDQLQDLYTLATDVANRPTRIAELFPTTPAHGYGTCDAAKSGFGGVWFPSEALGTGALVWRAPVPVDIQKRLVSDDNPHGDITNSDLELAGTILHEAVLAAETDLTERTVITGCDNTPAVAWRNKGSNSIDGPSAYLLRDASLQQRKLKHVPRVTYVPGTRNTLADHARRALDNASASARLSFQIDLVAAQEAAARSVGKDRARATDAVWSKCWLPFLADLNIEDPLLTGIPDKVPILRVFAQRVRDGRLSRSRDPVTSPVVRDYVLHVSKTITELGAPDPRYTDYGVMDPRLTRQYTGYKNADPAPIRVKPMPMSLLRQLEHHTNRQDPLASAIMDLAWIAVFYLLRPGEYCDSAETDPICVGDLSFLFGAYKIDHMICPLDLLDRATHSSITFDNQKNRERGETIGHGLSQEFWGCPTRALARRVAHIRSHNGTKKTPLCAVKLGNKWHKVKSKQITTAIQFIAGSYPRLGFLPSEVSARSMRAGGAMALLCAGVDTNIIRLIGRWKSDAMFRYLHAQAVPLVQHLAATMSRHGGFTLLPGSNIPAEAAHLPLQD